MFSVHYLNSRVWSFVDIRNVLVYFSVNQCSYYFVTSGKKGPRLKWTIYIRTNQTKIRIDYLSFNFGILGVVGVCSATCMHQLIKGLEYGIKISYFIQNCHAIIKNIKKKMFLVTYISSPNFHKICV